MKGPPKGAVRTLRLVLAYEGTQYSGWQRQKNRLSIQELLETELKKLTGEKITTYACSRTDAGVHARSQIVSFSVSSDRLAAPTFLKGLNARLPDDVRVLQSEERELTYLATRSVRNKTYRYFIDQNEVPSVFFRNFAWHVFAPLDIERMNEASAHLVGDHDFRAFQGADTTIKTTVRNIYAASWSNAPEGLLQFEICADGFLKYMVRNLVGTLVQIGRGKREPQDISRILRSKDRQNAGPKAPAHGLILWSVVEA